LSSPRSGGAVGGARVELVASTQVPRAHGDDTQGLGRSGEGVRVEVRIQRVLLCELY
jgi:hypothetical protein